MWKNSEEPPSTVGIGKLPYVLVFARVFVLDKTQTHSYTFNLQLLVYACTFVSRMLASGCVVTGRAATSHVGALASAVGANVMGA